MNCGGSARSDGECTLQSRPCQSVRSTYGVASMSVQEIEEQLATLTPSELERVEKLVRILRHVNEPGWKERVAKAHAEMDAGKKYYEADLQKVMGERRANAP